ncbi:MFS transporter [Profundibacter sp.]
MLLAVNKNYRLLFTATAISNLGDGISALAFPWLATLITRDPLLIALVAAATRLPWFLFAIPAGVITDRGNRQRLMVQADILRLLLTIGVVALILNGPALPLPENAGQAQTLILGLCAAAFLLGSAEVIRDNAAQTALPSIVDKEHLEVANGQMWSIEQIMGQFVGPPLAGLLIAYAVPLPFVVDAVTFAIAAWCVWLITMPARAAIKLPNGFWPQVREGMAWIYAHKLILRLAIMLGVLNMLHMISLTVLVLFSQEILGLGAAGFGILLTAEAAGGVLGGLFAPRIIARIGTSASLKIALGIFPLQYLVISLTSNAYVVAAALLVGMLAALLWNVVTVSLRQREIPDELLGRVNSIYRFFGWGTMPIGALIGGGLVAMFEPELGRQTALRLPFFVGAAGGLGLFIYGLARLRIRP